MKNFIAMIAAVAICQNSISQNVGIGTTTPQATLDVRGNQRFGGTTNYLEYDSASGKFEWIGSSLFVPVSQRIISHSASAEGLYAGGGKLDYRDQAGNPVFYSDWTNGNGYFAGNLGIGTNTPQHKLHLFTGASGASAPFGSNMLALESDGNINMSFLTPDAGQSTIWFSKSSSPLSGGIFYNNGVAPDGLIFRANNAPRLVITNAGRVGIGLNSPFSKLHVYGEESTADGNAAAIQLSNGAAGSGLNNWFLRAGATGTNTPAGGFSIGDNNANRFVIDNAGNVGIGISNPQFPLDINGRMRLSGTNPNDPGIWLNDAGIERAFVGLQNNDHVGFYGSGGIGWGFTMNNISGALSIAGNEGLPGQILTSNGSGAAASWSDLPSTKPYAFTIIPFFFNSLTGLSLSQNIAGVDNTLFTLNQNATVTYTLTLEVRADGPGTIDSKGYVVVEILNAASSRVSFASSAYYIKRSTSNTQVASGIALNLPSGTYTIKARLVRLSVGDGDVDAHATLAANEQGVQFIAQVMPD